MEIQDRTGANARIASAFKAASDATGASFDYLVSTSARESDLRPELEAKTSSAKGLFQFVDQTWLELVKKEGSAVGLDQYAAAITSDGKGGLTVADPAVKAHILALRSDPLVSSVMAGRFTRANSDVLTTSLGRTPSEGELYTAHVLGAAGAAKLIRMAEKEPTTTAAVAFPKAAAANPALFYGKGGTPRSASELLSVLSGNGADAQARVADAHAAIATSGTAKLDSAALAVAIRAQAAAKVSGESIAGAGVDRATAAKWSRAAFGQKSLPGASSEIVPAAGARVEGWRAKASADAFSMLMRSDGTDLTTDAAAASAAVTPTAIVPDAAATPLRMAAGGSQISVGGAAGGIPYVDPYQPMRLIGGAPSRTTPAIADQATAQRPSRLASRAAIGAPDMPLPMAEAGTVVRTSRIALAPAAAAAPSEPAPSGLVAPGAARVKTVSISLAPAAAPPARPALPPVAGEAAAGSPARPAAASAPAARAGRPLDLLDLSRLPGAGRRS